MTSSILLNFNIYRSKLESDSAAHTLPDSAIQLRGGKKGSAQHVRSCDDWELNCEICEVKGINKASNDVSVKIIYN